MADVLPFSTIAEAARHLLNDGILAYELPPSVCVLKVQRGGTSESRKQAAVETLTRLSKFYSDRRVKFEADTAPMPKTLQSPGDPVSVEVVEITLNTRDFLLTWSEFEEKEM